MRKTLNVLLLCLIALWVGSYAKADTIGPICASCNGASYTLTYKLTSNPKVVDVNLKVNATGTSAADTLKAVSLKLTSQSSQITAISTLSVPTGFSSVEAGGTSASNLGCSGSGNGYFCSQTTSTGVAAGGSGDVYNFIWQITLDSGSDLLTGLNAASVKAIYLTTNSHGKVSLAAQTSENITLTPSGPVSQITTTPEPTSLLLMASGLLGVALLIKAKPGASLQAMR